MPARTKAGSPGSVSPTGHKRLLRKRYFLLHGIKHATVLAPVKGWVLAMLGKILRVAPIPAYRPPLTDPARGGLSAARSAPEGWASSGGFPRLFSSLRGILTIDDPVYGALNDISLLPQRHTMDAQLRCISGLPPQDATELSYIQPYTQRAVSVLLRLFQVTLHRSRFGRASKPTFDLRNINHKKRTYSEM